MTPWTKYDWNGDGKVDSWDDVYELGMLNWMIEDNEQRARENRIRKLEYAIIQSGLTSIEREDFQELCRKNGEDIHNFDQSDLDELERRLNS